MKVSNEIFNTGRTTTYAQRKRIDLDALNEILDQLEPHVKPPEAFATLETIALGWPHTKDVFWCDAVEPDKVVFVGSEHLAPVEMKRPEIRVQCRPTPMVIDVVHPIIGRFWL